MHQVSARAAVGFALQRENLLLYGLVVVGWFVASGGLRGVTYGLRNIVPELGVLFEMVGVLLQLGGTVVVLVGLVALVYRAAVEAP